MHSPPQILIVDDKEDNRRILKGQLVQHGYAVRLASDGLAALAEIAAEAPDLVLLDVMMPGIDGFETVRRIRAQPSLPFIPVILLTARSATADIVTGLEAGADEFLTKPVEQASLLARVAAALRIKALQDEVTGWNAALEARVVEQVALLERMGSLKRFLAPQIVDAILATADGQSAIASHRREVAVLFCDFRGFTPFSETADPEDVIGLLDEYHEVVGEVVFRHHGTIERFAGDAVMVVFNDPLPREDYCLDAAASALAILEASGPLLAKWRGRGAGLGLGIGITSGFATLGAIGWRERRDYAAIGTSTNLASRLSAQAASGQILVNGRFAQSVAEIFDVPLRGDFELKGFARSIPVHELVGRRR